MNAWKTIVLYLAILLAAVGLSLASLGFVRPARCLTLCTEPLQSPCPDGSCRFGEQKAGFPLPIVIDNEAGSPPGGWGKVGLEDLPNPLFFLADVLFYSLLLWVLISAVRAIRERPGKQAFVRLALPSGVVVLLLAVGLIIYRPPSPASPPLLSDPRGAILGSWRAADSLNGKEFIFRFYEEGRVTMTPPGSDDQISGEYQWVPTGALRLAFSTMRSPSTAKSGLCDLSAAFLRPACRASVSNPADYPAPASAKNAAYPVPTPGPVVWNSIDAEFQVSVKDNRLTLALPEGEKQEFSRIVK